jgi:hypothetical protein
MLARFPRRGLATVRRRCRRRAYDASVDLALLNKLVHVLVGFAFVAGIVGRTLAIRQAARSDDLAQVHTLMTLGGRFERLLVIPGSMLVTLFGLTTAWFQGYPILGFLVGGTTNWVLVSLLIVAFIVVLVPTIFLPRGRIFEAALAAADARGQVTPELRAAFADRQVAFARTSEAIAIIVLIVIMVTKPF